MLPESTYPSIAPWSELHLFGNSLTFPQSSWYQLLRKWVKPYINPSVFFFFFPFSIYPQLFSASWWNTPENNLQPHTVDSALMLLTWKAFGMHYLSIKLLLKDKDLLLGNVLFTSMSLGIRYGLSLPIINLTWGGKALKYLCSDYYFVPISYKSEWILNANQVIYLRLS